MLFSSWFSAAAVTLTATSLKVLLDGGLIGVQHCPIVFHEVPNGTISRFSLATRCSWCSAGVLEGSVTWSHLSVSPLFAYPVLLICGVDMGVRCGPKEFTAYWQDDFELLHVTSQCLTWQLSLA